MLENNHTSLREKINHLLVVAGLEKHPQAPKHTRRSRSLGLGIAIDCDLRKHGNMFLCLCPLLIADYMRAALLKKLARLLNASDGLQQAFQNEFRNGHLLEKNGSGWEGIHVCLAVSELEDCWGHPSNGIGIGTFVAKRRHARKDTFSLEIRLPHQKSAHAPVFALDWFYSGSRFIRIWFLFGIILFFH